MLFLPVSSIICRSRALILHSLGEKSVCQGPSCTPIGGSPAPLGACAMSPRQVNGAFNCLHTSSSSSSSLISVNVEERFGKQNPLKNLVAVSDATCIAARIRPVCKCKKRKLVRATSVSHFSRKPLKPLTVKCCCEWPNSCILCSCKASLQTIDPDTMSLEERIALLDSGVHPILSLSHGNPLHLHFETLLREHRLHSLLSHELKTLKISHSGKKPYPTDSVFPKLHSSLLLASLKLSKTDFEVKVHCSKGEGSSKEYPVTAFLFPVLRHINMVLCTTHRPCTQRLLQPLLPAKPLSLAAWPRQPQKEEKQNVPATSTTL
ncbi:KAT8 regulatory NSL complex subunit 1-like [Morus bassanus]